MALRRTEGVAEILAVLEEEAWESAAALAARALASGGTRSAVRRRAVRKRVSVRRLGPASGEVHLVRISNALLGVVEADIVAGRAEFARSACPCVIARNDAPFEHIAKPGQGICAPRSCDRERVVAESFAVSDARAERYVFVHLREAAPPLRRGGCACRAEGTHRWRRDNETGAVGHLHQGCWDTQVADGDIPGGRRRGNGEARGRGTTRKEA